MAFVGIRGLGCRCHRPGHQGSSAADLHDGAITLVHDAHLTNSFDKRYTGKASQVPFQVVDATGLDGLVEARRGLVPPGVCLQGQS
jgi:hypothetical protein